MHGFDDSQLVLLVWALAAAKYHGPSGNNGKDTLSMVEVDLRRRKTKNMSDENLATLVWAFTKQGHSGGGGLLRVQKELMKRSWLEPQHEGKFSWSLTNRRMKQKDSKRPNKPPKPTMPDEMVCGLQQMGFASEIDVVLDGGCWAVDGSTNFPQEGGTDRRHLHEGELRQQRYSHVPEICRAAQNGEGCFQQYFEAEQSAAAGTEQSTWARPCGAR